MFFLFSLFVCVCVCDCHVISASVSIDYMSKRLGQPYGHINFTADVQFNETSELYIVVLSWVNPPGPVDSFSLDAHIKGQFKPSIKIPSVWSARNQMHVWGITWFFCRFTLLFMFINID